MNFFKRDRTFREPIGKLTTFFMIAFHIGAIAALFMFTWKAFFVAMLLWWVAGSLGIGIAQGFATIGAIGFEGRWDYSAIGTVTNLAARLCGEARGNQILISQRVYAGVETLVDVDPQEAMALKGFRRPVIAYRMQALKAPRS